MLTVVPSTTGSRSRCTPWRDTSGPCARLRAADLVELVEEDDALVLDQLDRLLGDDLAVDQGLGLLLEQDLAGLA